jgi:hypothetical protein
MIAGDGEVLGGVEAAHGALCYFWLSYGTDVCAALKRRRYPGLSFGIAFGVWF